MEWSGMEWSGMEYVYFPSYHYKAQMGQYNIGGSFVHHPDVLMCMVLVAR